MKISVLTLFPEMFVPLRTSILGKAAEKSIIDVNIIDIREFSSDKHKKCDDYPFGGGPGMVMTPQPIFDAINAIDPARKALRIFMSPKGKVLTQDCAKQLLSTAKDIIILCGHYEGVDQRIIDLCIDTEISIGDYVLTGGELPAMVLIDVLARFIPGVLGSSESADNESFSDGFLEYPHYTRPQTFEGITVPDVLVSGHHANVLAWRKKQSEEITKKRRPDLLKENSSDSTN